MSDKQHAMLSPSGAHRWLTCPASALITLNIPDVPSLYADEGTAAHYFAAYELNAQASATGMEYVVNDTIYKNDGEMPTHIKAYRNLVESFPGDLHVEVELPVGLITGEQGAIGTADAVIINGDTLTVCDLKYGRGVRVEAKHNEQLMLYALAALKKFDNDEVMIERVQMVICQPRINHTELWECTTEHLREFGARVFKVANRIFDLSLETTLPADSFNPTESACQFCRAKGVCHALRNKVLAAVAGDFTDISEPIASIRAGEMRKFEPNVLLGDLLTCIPLIEDWCTAIRTQAEIELMAGREVKGFKLVAGRAGSRKWVDDKVAEEKLKSMRLKVEQMYDMKLISPTTAEKLHKAETIGSRQWASLQALITKAEGKPSVVPESDKRPALSLSATADEFPVLDSDLV